MTSSTNSSLPVVSSSVTIDGSGQVVVIDGSAAGFGVDGLTFTGGDSVVQELTIVNFSGSGIVLSWGGNNVITDILLGTTGFDDQGNGGDGVLVRQSPDNIIEFNTISGNEGRGIHILDWNSFNNEIAHNNVGVTLGGDSAIGNAGDGVGCGNAGPDGAGA